MTYTPESFEEFMAALEAHPEWQVRLRRILLDEALAPMRKAIEDLAAEIRAFAAETRAHFESVDADIAQLKTDVAWLKGDAHERFYRERVTGIFGDVMDKPRVLFPVEVPGMREARRDGRITDEEWRDLKRVDALISGVDDSGATQYFALEAAWRLDEADVERVVRRAALVARVTGSCIPAVGGRVVDEAVAALAHKAGVRILEDGDFRDE